MESDEEIEYEQVMFNILELNSLSKTNENMLISFQIEFILNQDPIQNKFKKDLIENKEINLMIENGS